MVFFPKSYEQFHYIQNLLSKFDRTLLTYHKIYGCDFNNTLLLFNFMYVSSPTKINGNTCVKMGFLLQENARFFCFVLEKKKNLNRDEKLILQN